MSHKLEKDKISNRYHSRRQFLVGAGKATLALPTLASLIPKAMAQSISAAPRLCLFGSANGMWTEDFLVPNKSKLTNKLTRFNDDIHYAKIRDIGGAQSYCVDSTFSDLYDDINLYRGLDWPRLQMHTNGIWAAAQKSKDQLIVNGLTIDNIIERSSGFKRSYRGDYPTTIVTERKSGISSWSFNKRSDGSYYERASLRGDARLFEKMFSEQLSPPPSHGGSNPNLLLVDKVLEDLNSLKNHKRLSIHDKEMLDWYADGLFEIQNGLVDPTDSPLSCSPFSMNFEAKITNPDFINVNAAKLCENYFKIMARAFACDRTRTFMMLPTFRHPHHEDDGTSKKGCEGQKAFIGQIGDFARDLKRFSDPISNGNLLDNTLIIWMNEHNERGQHRGYNLPILTMGRMGGRVKSGYYVDYTQKDYLTGPNADYPKGHLYKQLLITAMRGMGVTASEHNQHGDGYGFGTYRGPSSTEYISSPHEKFFWGLKYYAKFKDSHNDPLPFVST